MDSRRLVRVAAVGDLHCTKTTQGARSSPSSPPLAPRPTSWSSAGDLTDYGLREEARVLARELAGPRSASPSSASLGNHDYESGQQDEVVQILRSARGRDPRW
jgi:hypothetical protein